MIATCLANSSQAAVDMDTILKAEHDGIEAAMCPGTASMGGTGGAMDDYALHQDPHPFVTGHDGVKRWAETLRRCTREVLSQKRTAGL